jgi:predicted metal-dependent hydrolase
MDRASRRDLVESLTRDAERIAAAFGLRYASIEAERAGVSRYGICYSDGRIRIRLRHASTGQPLKYSSLVNTLCHELAHLRHFNHGERFKAFYFRLLDWARAEGIYRPGRETPAPARAKAPPRPRGPVQLDLFGDLRSGS